MNTRSVADLLGISTRTVQRWVKQLNLDMARNDLGHFVFSEEDIELLKEVKKQLDHGVTLQDVSVKRNRRTGVVKNNISAEEKQVQPEMTQPQQDKKQAQQIVSQIQLEEILESIKSLQVGLHQKADSVVSYQLIQHRREIEELRDQVAKLTERISSLETLLIKERQAAASLEGTDGSPRKKKGFLKGIFGF